ncbi:geranylgeranyl reductase family protein [[Eubacterium] cellulosolvens]
MSNNTDVLVVGGGPAGLIFAEKVSRKGIPVTLFEEHSDIGIPSHCAGLLSIKGLERIGIIPSSECIENSIKGAIFHSPKDITFKVESEKSLAYVINRVKFDQSLARSAKEKGVRIQLSRRIVDLSKIGERIVGCLDNEDNEMKSRITVSAEGINGHLIKRAGLETLKKSHILPAVQFEMCNVNLERDLAHIFLGKRYSTNFFTWIIPTGKDSARVGLASLNQNIVNRLDQFVKENLKTAVKVSTKAGHIYTGGPIRKTCCEGFLAIGDVCGQIKPTTGGGVILGGLCASIAAEAVLKIYENIDLTYPLLREYYERKWRNQLQRQFNSMLFSRRILNSLTDHTVDHIFKLITRSDIVEDIRESIDMDFQSDIIKKVIKKSVRSRIFFLVIKDILSQLMSPL